MVGLAAGAVLVVNAFACGSDTPAPPPPKFPDVPSFCTGVATSQCTTTVINNCEIEASGSDDAQHVCITAAAKDCVQGKLGYLEITTQNLGEYHFDVAENCVNQVAAAYADAQVSSAEIATLRTACDVVFSPRTPVGGNCDADFECDSTKGLACIFHASGGASTGTCQIPVTVQGGADCSAADAKCVAPQVCIENTLNHQQNCITPSTANEACIPNTAPCDAADNCLADPTSTTGAFSCQPKASNLAACAVDNDCASGVCGTVVLSNGTVFGECLSQIIFAPSEPQCANFGSTATNIVAPTGGAGGTTGAGGAPSTVGGSGGSADVGGSDAGGSDAGGAGGGN